MLRPSASVLFFTVVGLSAQAQNAFDARIDDYVGLRYPCGDQVLPTLRITNVGTQAMTTCEVETWKNGFINNTFNWILATALQPGLSRMPSLAPVGSVAEGDVLEFRIRTVNGNADEGAEQNILSVPMTDEKGDAGSYMVQVKVMTDETPEETTWAIKDAAGIVVAQGGPYNEENTEKNTLVDLSASTCYNFEVYDSGGNGIGGERSVGYAKVISLGEEVVSVDGADFTTLYRKGVSTGSADGCMPTQLTSAADPVISCGANGLRINGSSTIWAEEVTGANKYKFRFTNIPGQPAYTRNIAVPTRSLVVEPWATLPLKRGRTYNVQVQASFDNGATYCAFTPSACTVRVGYDMSRSELRSAMQDGSMPSFTLFPNPVADGRVQLNVQELGVEDGSLFVQVLDPVGREVYADAVIVQQEGVATIDLGTSMASGVYIVRLTIEGTTLTERLVVR